MNKTTLVFLLLCVISLSVAKVLFVSPFGSNENSGISASSPLKSIKRAQLQAVHGDVIQLARGLYQGPNNCIDFDSVNVTLRGPAKLQCPEGLRIEGVNFNASDIFLPNITVSHADNVTLTHCKINRGFSSFAVSKLNLTQISFMRVSNISSFATNFTCTNCSVNGEALLNVTKGSFECVNCNFPLTFVNATKLTSFVTLNSTFSGIENSNMTTRKGLHKATPYCNITSTNVTCEDSGFSGLTLYKANCSINNSTIENCSTGSNNTTNGTAININYSNCTCYNVTVQNNYGNSSIYVGSDSNFTMVNGSVSNNYGNDTTRGGGIYISSGSEAHVINSTLENNIAYVGGAFYVENGGKIFLTQTSIVRNTAFIAGDFACAVGRNIEDFSPVHLKECSVVENLAMSGVENNCSV